MSYPVNIYLSCRYTFFENVRTKKHTHSTAYQLFYCISGETERSCVDKKFRLSQGQFVIVPPNTSHDMVCRVDGEVLDIKFGVSDNRLAKKLNQIATKRIVCPEVNHLFLQIAELAGTQDRDCLRRQELYLETAFYETFKALFDQKETRQDKQTGAESQIEEIITRTIVPFIDGYIILPVKKFSARELSYEAGYNSRYLGRKFEEVVGMSLTKYYYERRIAIAKKFLVNTDLPIREIASILNFDNATYFSKYFKDKTGLLPKTYRAQNKEKFIIED